MKQYTYSSISLRFLFLSTLILGGVLFFSLRTKTQHSQLIPHYHVALISFSNRKHQQEAIDGFKKVLDAHPGATFSYKWYAGREEQILVRAFAKELLQQKKFDLVFAHGMCATQILTEEVKKITSPPPVFFTGVLNSTWSAWEAERPELRSLFTGTVGHYSWNRRLHLLRIIKPRARNVIIPYSLNFANYDKELVSLKRSLIKQNFIPHLIPVRDQVDMRQIVLPKLTPESVLLMMRDPAIYQSRDQIIRYCRRRRIATYACDIESVELGASCGYGIKEEQMGIIPGKQAIQHLFEKKPLLNIPIIDIEDNGSRFVINEKTMEEQGITLPSDHIFLIKKGNIVKGSS